MTFFQLALLSAFVTFSLSANGENTTLLLVQTITRHGERNPHFLYPNDPNSPDDFPSGLGQITQLGKKQQYDVGKFFRSLYKDFATSDPNQVHVNSSSQDRCLISGEAQLAGFFPPGEKWKFTDDLDWQPIPVHYQPEDIDNYFDYTTNCPRAKETVEFKELNEYYQQHQSMVEKISNYSGLDYSHPKSAFHLYSILEIEKTHNLIIPEWADMYWDELKFVEQQALKAFYESPIQIRLRVGMLIQLINDNMKKKINGEFPDLKFILSFTHDEQIAGYLGAMNYTEIARPGFCWTLLIELHEMADTSKTVRVRYMNSTYPLEDEAQPHVLTIDGCSEFCPLEYFTNSFQQVIPNNITEECRSNTSDSSAEFRSNTSHSSEE